MFAARIIDAAARARVEVRLLSDPAALPSPDEVSLLLVDWNDRREAWGEELTRWVRSGGDAVVPRLVLFGSHTDLAAHAEAKRHGIGPVMARSAFVTRLGEIIAAA